MYIYVYMYIHTYMGCFFFEGVNKRGILNFLLNIYNIGCEDPNNSQLFLFFQERHLEFFTLYLKF